MTVGWTTARKKRATRKVWHDIDVRNEQQKTNRRAASDHREQRA